MASFRRRGGPRRRRRWSIRMVDWLQTLASIARHIEHHVRMPVEVAVVEILLFRQHIRHRAGLWRAKFLFRYRFFHADRICSCQAGKGKVGQPELTGRTERRRALTQKGPRISDSKTRSPGFCHERSTKQIKPFFPSTTFSSLRVSTITAGL